MTQQASAVSLRFARTAQNYKYYGLFLYETRWQKGFLKQYKTDRQSGVVKLQIFGKLSSSFNYYETLT